MNRVRERSAFTKWHIVIGYLIERLISKNRDRGPKSAKIGAINHQFGLCLVKDFKILYIGC